VEAVVARRPGEGPFTIRFADVRQCTAQPREGQPEGSDRRAGETPRQVQSFAVQPSAVSDGTVSYPTLLISPLIP
jgi:hypothetical protein